MGQCISAPTHHGTAHTSRHAADGSHRRPGRVAEACHSCTREHTSPHSHKARLPACLLHSGSHALQHQAAMLHPKCCSHYLDGPMYKQTHSILLSDTPSQAQPHEMHAAAAAAGWMPCAHPSLPHLTQHILCHPKTASSPPSPAPLCLIWVG
jgi:hypothetical protein